MYMTKVEGQYGMTMIESHHQQLPASRYKLIMKQ